MVVGNGKEGMAGTGEKAREGNTNGGKGVWWGTQVQINHRWGRQVFGEGNKMFILVTCYCRQHILVREGQHSVCRQ